jgi:hypothetical protein
MTVSIAGPDASTRLPPYALTDDELLAGLEAWPFVRDGLEAYRRYLAERR